MRVAAAGGAAEEAMRREAMFSSGGGTSNPRSTGGFSSGGSSPFRTVGPPNNTAYSNFSNSSPTNSGYSNRDLALSTNGPGSPSGILQHVGHGKGEYVQVTNFRYVGDGMGHFNIDRPEEARQGRSMSVLKWSCACLLLGLLGAGVGWVMWPEDLQLGEDWDALMVGDESTTTTTTAPPRDGIRLKMLVQDLDFVRLSQERNLDKFSFAIKYAIAFYVGHGVRTKQVAVRISDDTEHNHVLAFVMPACTVDSKMLAKNLNFTSIARAVTANLATTSGWKQSHASSEAVVTRVIAQDHFEGKCSMSQSELEAWVDEIETAVSTTAPSKADCFKENMNFDDGGEFVGKLADVATADACQEECSSRTACIAFSYDTMGRWPTNCFLQSSVSHLNRQVGFISGPRQCEAQNVLVLTGASGPSSNVLNGQYKVSSETMHGHNIYQKVDNADVWVVFQVGRWYVTDTARKVADTGGGWAYSVNSNVSTPANVTEWEEWLGQEWARSNMTFSYQEVTALASLGIEA